MTQEKQIEEMARLISITTEHCGVLAVSECIKRKCEYPHFEGVTCRAEHQAEALYNAGYRKQSENVIELPCTVGTTLYFLYNSPYADKPDLTPRIYKTTDWQFEVDKTGIVITTSDIHSFNKKYDYYLGEAVFLTQEEAEKVIAELKKKYTESEGGE